MSKRVLLVDDDESTRLVVSAILKMHGYEVLTLSDCQDILAQVEKYNPMVVLMDVWMPGTGGEYAAKALKTNPSTARIPVILFSSEDEIMSTSARAGAEGAITKPFDLMGLPNIIAQYMPPLEQAS